MTLQPLIADSPSVRGVVPVCACRCCGERSLVPVLDLGMMPLTAAFVTEERRHLEEPRYPLKVVFCPSCSLVQIEHTVPPERIFLDDYPYYSSFIPALLSHARENALALIDRYNLGPSSLVVELGSNDGYLLRNFVERGIPVLGIDPAAGPCAAAEKVGVHTLCDFFTPRLAERLVREVARADVIIANNVMAHVPDPHAFVDGIALLLKDTGVLVTESPSLRSLVQNVEFDTIYHEHVCYFSVTALKNLFARSGLFINDIQPLDIHGGSYRYFVSKQDHSTPIVQTMLDEERALGMNQPVFYQDFGARVERLREKLSSLLMGLKQQGKSIAAYGAAAKGVILLNWLGPVASVIDFVADRNIHKHGKYMPGLKIKVLPPQVLTERCPDYTLILAWNFKDEIIAQQQEYLQKNGRFIIPIPEPIVI